MLKPTFQALSDGILISATVGFALAYCCFGFFAGTVLSLLGLPWFYIVHNKDDGWRKSIFIISSWITTIIGFIFVLTRTNSFLSGNSGSLVYTKPEDTMYKQQRIVKYLIIAQISLIGVAAISQCVRLYLATRARKRGFSRAK